jgi:hypothetical protein
MTAVQARPHNPGSELAAAGQTNNLVAMAATVDKADIIAIGVINFEKQLEQGKARLNAQIDQVKKGIADHETSINRTCTAAGMATDLSVETALCQSIAAAGFARYQPSVHVTEITEAQQTIDIQVAISPKGVRNSNEYYRSSHAHSREFKIAFPAEAKKELKQLKAARDMLKNLTGQLAEVHRKLASVPSLERQARAKMAQVQLEKSPEGRELLAQLATLNSDNMPRFLLPAGK